MKNDSGETGFKILVGGGLGRTPYIGMVIREFLEKKYLLSYLEAILRVYNRYGRRDNIHKARIKILVNKLGREAFAGKVEKEWEQIRDSVLLLDQKEIDRMKTYFAAPDYDETAAEDQTFEQKQVKDKDFANWAMRNVKPHKVKGYRAVYISLKSPQSPPGDVTAEQMEFIADLADCYSYGEIRSTHDQNLILADVKQGDLYELWNKLKEQELATPNIGLLTDMICCPGLDFCSLANAGSIPVARQINDKFADLDYLHDIGDIQIKMSGCMNACGHHHVGHIGILGVNKQGSEFYQLTLGGSPGNDAALGDRLGPAIAKADVADTIGLILEVYVENRNEGERFLDTYRRLGIEPFKSRVYAAGSTENEKVRAVAGH